LSGDEHNLVSFAGDLTVASISQAHAELAAAFAQDGPVVVDIEGVSEIDLTFVQLHESARRKAAETGRDLTLRQPAGGAVLEVLRRGGFFDDQTSERTRFWLQGNAQ
jgi:anti-anti-sigma regulatory factor